MAVLIAPTKSNLIKAKASLELSSKGFELMDKKRNVLVNEMMSLVERSKAIQAKIYDKIDEAYRNLQSANVTSGIKNVENIAHSVPKDESFEILLKSIMGATVPIIKYTKQPILPTYGFYNTNSALDAATVCFREVRYLIYELAEIDNSVFKLAKEIQKTKKRTNALEHIQIPRYKEQIKYISEALEEKEREDFFRLKRIQNQTN